MKPAIEKDLSQSVLVGWILSKLIFNDWSRESRTEFTFQLRIAASIDVAEQATGGDYRSIVAISSADLGSFGAGSSSIMQQSCSKKLMYSLILASEGSL